jgi:hypothetical protein
MGVDEILRDDPSPPHPQNPFTPPLRLGPLPSGNVVQPNLMNRGRTGWVRTSAAGRLSSTEVHRRGLILRDEGQMAESQLSELRNMRVLLEEARVLARNLAYHRRARLEEGIGQVLDEIDRQIEELRSDRG